MLCYHNRIRMNFVSNCTSQLVEKKQLPCLCSQKQHYLLHKREMVFCVHVHSQREWNKPSSVTFRMFHFSISDFIFHHNICQSHHCSMTDGSSHEKHFGKISHTSQENLHWVSHDMNKSHHLPQRDFYIWHRILFIMETFTLRNNITLFLPHLFILSLGCLAKVLLQDLKSHSAKPSQEYHSNFLKSIRLEGKYTSIEKKEKSSKALLIWPLAECFKIHL